MKLFVIALSLLAALEASKIVTKEDIIDLENVTTSEYVTKLGQPLAKSIPKIELSSTTRKVLNPTKRFPKIIDGTAAHLGHIPYQAGLIVHYNDGGATCGGSLISAKRVLTAAHCWWDGENRAHMFTVVLGSEKLFAGGIRMRTSKVVMHKRWNPQKVYNDIAMVYLPRAVRFSNTIQPIALPFGRKLRDDFVGESVVASGYGNTRHGNTLNSLFYVNLNVVSNEECSLYYEDDIRPTEMCAWSPEQKARNICDGDSGGPLVLVGNNRKILVGITSYGTKNCSEGIPSGYTRVTSYIKWIRKYLH